MSVCLQCHCSSCVCVQKADVCTVGIVKPVLQCMPQAQLSAQYMAVTDQMCPVPVTHSMPGVVVVVLRFTNVAGGTPIYEANLYSLCSEAWYRIHSMQVKLPTHLIIKLIGTQSRGSLGNFCYNNY